jgi:hypothetical protein
MCNRLPDPNAFLKNARRHVTIRFANLQTFGTARVLITAQKHLPNRLQQVVTNFPLRNSYTKPKKGILYEEQQC